MGLAKLAQLHTIQKAMASEKDSTVLSMTTYAPSHLRRNENGLDSDLVYAYMLPHTLQLDTRHITFSSDVSLDCI